MLLSSYRIIVASVSINFAFFENGVPQVKEGAVSKAHGGVLFIDEIGELQTCQITSC